MRRVTRCFPEGKQPSASFMKEQSFFLLRQFHRLAGEGRHFREQGPEEVFLRHLSHRLAFLEQEPHPGAPGEPHRGEGGLPPRHEAGENP